MKKTLLLFCIAGLLLLFSGCELPMVPDSYTVVTEHTETLRSVFPDAYTVSTEAAFCDAVLELTRSALETGVIRIPDNFFDGTDDDLNALLYRVWKTDPLGAYAIDYITADTVKTVGYTEVTLHITYRRSLAEISSITQVRGKYGLQRAIVEALQNYSPYVILQVTGYSETDCESVISEYCKNNPAQIMETPTVDYSIYPAEADAGTSRIVEVFYDYTHSSMQLREMRNSVEAVLSAGAEYVSYREDEAGKYELLYTYLAERFDYDAKPSQTPLYSLLCEGIISSETVSNAYYLLCEGAGLHCRIVSGYLDGNAYYWNIITMAGTSFHIDLLRDIQNGLHTPTLRSDSEMVSYSWDSDLYPKCEPQEEEPEPQPAQAGQAPYVPEAGNHDNGNQDSGQTPGEDDVEPVPEDPSAPEQPPEDPGDGEPTEPGEGGGEGSETPPPEAEPAP